MSCLPFLHDHTAAVAGISTNTGHDGDTDDGEWAGPHNDVSVRIGTVYAGRSHAGRPNIERDC